MKIKAYAKINLSLDLTGRLPDGYHAINTVMQSVSLYDTVTVHTSGEGISLTCDSPEVPCDERNTAFKAAKLFCEAAGIAPEITIHIEKRIPSQAGLAGGSADAAAVLAALRNIYAGALSEKELYAVALKVGADVPFCLKGGTCLCLNKGEEMTSLPAFDACVLLAKPEKGVSTAEAFRRFDAAEGLIHPDNARVLEAYKNGAGEKAAPLSLNLFEQLVDLPEGKAIKDALTENGAYYASMSGSGSCFFGLFHDAAACRSAEKALKDLVPFTAVCRTVSAGTETAEKE